MFGRFLGNRNRGSAYSERLGSNQSRTYTFSCILDENPRFYVELVLWAICARKFLPQGKSRIIVYTVGAIPSDLIDWLQNLDIGVQAIGTVIEGSPHSNKIAPFLQSHPTDVIVVCDTDLFFLGDPVNLLRSERIRAAPNNHCNPPSHIFERILFASGLNRPYRPGIALFKGADGRRETHINNISAGIVAAPVARAAELGAAWKKWAGWLVSNRRLLEVWSVHVDQVAFALALEELGEDVEFLPPQLNAILHLFEELTSCVAVHLTTIHIPSFPERFNDDRTLRAQGLSDGMAASLGRLNACILEAGEQISRLPSTRGHYDKFLNPSWVR